MGDDSNALEKNGHSIMKVLVRYISKSHQSEWNTSYHLLPVDIMSVPDRKGRNGLDISEWLEQFPTQTPPDRLADAYEERGDGWTAHIFEYYFVIK